MKFPESWLRQLVDPPLDSAQLAHALTMAGLEVEAREPVALPFSKVIVAHVLVVRPHPNADRLRVCEVDAGRAEKLQVVCGAPNVAAGQKVALAQAEQTKGQQRTQRRDADGKPSAAVPLAVRLL